MAKISKKKKLKILDLTVWPGILADAYQLSGFRYTGGYFWDHPPDNWDQNEKELFDTVTAIEDKLKARILEILENDA